MTNRSAPPATSGTEQYVWPMPADRLSPRLLHGGQVLTTEPSLRRFDVVIDGERIVDLVEPGERGSPQKGDLDVTGLVVAPGFIDLQINGGWGVDFTTDPEAIERVAHRLPSTGVTAFCPTVITAPPATRLAALVRAGRLVRAAGTAAALGLHLEGPIINPERAGAHDRRYIPTGIPPDAARWSRRNGVTVVTLAPESDGALELIPDLVSRGVVVALGHTAAAPEVVGEAVRRGATLATHLFNAMTPFHHRQPGPVGAVLDCDDLMVSLICDGVHVHPTAVALAWRILGPDRTILVSDATAALGDSQENSLRLAGRPLAVDGGAVRNEDGPLAGSVSSLDRAARNLVAFSRATPAEALHTITANPARVLGLSDRGRITPGARADLVVLTPELRVVGVLIGGRLV